MDLAWLLSLSLAQSPAPPADPAPAPPPEPAVEAPRPAAQPPAPQVEAPSAAEAPKGAEESRQAEPSPSPKPRPARKPTATPTAAPTPAPTPAARPRPDALALAERFLAALSQRRAEELSALCRPGFSFDGRVASSAEEVQRRWGEILAARTGPHEKVEGIEILPPAEAAARLGKPPRRLEPALAGAAAVALATVGGRPVALFLVRQGSGWAASGMSD